jgi:hypothetical protein
MDACNIYNADLIKPSGIFYTGVGRGEEKPQPKFIDFVYKSFRAMEKGLANELLGLIEFYNAKYAHDNFSKVNFDEVQRLSKTCSTGSEIANPGKVEVVPEYNGFSSRLVECAFISTVKFRDQDNND